MSKLADWWHEIAGAWQRAQEILSSSIAKEVAYSLGLMLLVAILVLGYKPKLSVKKIWIVGLLLAISNLALLYFIQERNLALYLLTFSYIALPIYLFIDDRKKGAEVMLGFTAVVSAIHMLIYREFGWVAQSYASALMMGLVLIPIFQAWRNPKEEGFIKLKWKHWDWAMGAFCVFLTITVVMVMCRWDGLMGSKFSEGIKKLILPLFLLFFFFVKAIPEELVFRGIFQGALKDKFGFLPALTSSALLYGICALNDPAPWAFPNWRATVNSVALGLGCGVVYNKTRSLAISAVVNASVSFLWWFVFEHGGH